MPWYRMPRFSMPRSRDADNSSTHAPARTIMVLHHDLERHVHPSQHTHGLPKSVARPNSSSDYNRTIVVGAIACPPHLLRWGVITRTIEHSQAHCKITHSSFLAFSTVGSSAPATARPWQRRSAKAVKSGLVFQKWLKKQRVPGSSQQRHLKRSPQRMKTTVRSPFPIPS